MVYERLNLVNGDRFTASHVEHIDNALEYITQYCDESFSGFSAAFINLIGGYEANVLMVDPDSGAITQILSETQFDDQDAELRLKKWVVYEPEHKIGSFISSAGYKILQQLAFDGESGVYIFSTTDQSQLFIYYIEGDIWKSVFWNYNLGMISVDENNKFYSNTNLNVVHDGFQIFGTLFFGSAPRYTITRVNGSSLDVGQCIQASNAMADGIEIPYMTFEFPVDKFTFTIYHYDGTWITEEDFSHIPQ